MLYPGLRGPQHGATTALKPRGRETITKAYLQAQIPSKRAELRRREDLALYEAEQEEMASQHEAEMTLQKERLAAEKEAQAEHAAISREGLAMESKYQKEAKKQAKYGTWLQSAGLALQAWETLRPKQDDWIMDYGYTGGGDGGGGGWGGGDGWSGYYGGGGGGISYGGSW